MWKRILSLVVIIVLLAAIQLGFINTLPFFWNRLNIFLIAIIFAPFFKVDVSTRLLLFLFLGLAADLFSFYFFGYYLMLLPLLVICANFLVVNFFSVKSLFSFLTLGLIMIVVNNLLSWLLLSIFGLTKFASFYLFLQEFGVDLLGNLLLITVIYFLVSKIRR